MVLLTVQNLIYYSEFFWYLTQRTLSGWQVSLPGLADDGSSEPLAPWLKGHLEMAVEYA